MAYIRAVYFLIIISLSSASIVKFVPSTSFNLPMNFNDGKLPCSKQTVVFPDTLMGSIRLASKTSVSGLILPRDGEIYLDEALIALGVDEADVNCTEANVYYIERAVVSWAQPDIWSSGKYNAATPDAEKVPCFDDTVVFSGNTEFILTLPDQTQFVAGIKVGEDSYNTEIFKSMVGNSEHFIFNRFSETGLRVEQKQCLSRAGCPCQRNGLEMDCEAKFCAVPLCNDPIKPAGHCCKICGGVISFNIDETFDIMVFKELVQKTVESYGEESLVYHIGRLPHNKIQLVVVDKAEYSGTSAEVVNAIDHQMQRHWVQGAKFVDISGSPLDKSNLGGKIFFSMFFLVVFVMVGIYVYYYKLSEMTDVRFPIMHRNAPGMFSRFQTRTDSVVCLTRRDSGVPIASGDTAFRNPLYDSTRRVEADAASDD